MQIRLPFGFAIFAMANSEADVANALPHFPFIAETNLGGS
jgi:hypothetical protein